VEHYCKNKAQSTNEETINSQLEVNIKGTSRNITQLKNEQLSWDLQLQFHQQKQSLVWDYCLKFYPLWLQQMASR
jgi:hypothetical protein